MFLARCCAHFLFPERSRKTWEKGKTNKIVVLFFLITTKSYDAVGSRANVASYSCMKKINKHRDIYTRNDICYDDKNINKFIILWLWR